MEQASENNKLLKREINELERKVSSLLVKINHQATILDEIKKSLEALKSEDPKNVKEQINFIIQRIKKTRSQNWDEFMQHFEKIYPNFYDQILELNPKLSPNDLKHCAYIKMKLNKKEIAHLFSINHRSVEMAHYRIKKKLMLDPDTSLSSFILNIGQQRPQ